jgi:hypothetical protein
MTTYINNQSKIDESVLLSSTEEVKDTSPEALNDAISKALANVSDRLDEGHSDPETVRLLGNLRAALVATAKGNATPTSLIPGVPTPTSLIPDAGTTPTTLIPTVSLIHNKKDLQEKLFAWIRIYTLNAIYAMPGSMLENSNAIQQYMTDGLNKLSEVVMKDSQEWSDFGQACMTAIQTMIVTESKNPKDDANTKSMIIGTYTTSFNLQNTCYQKNLELFSSLNDGINQTSTSTTQTQTLNNQNITQGPLAMITMLTQCWSVIA